MLTIVLSYLFIFVTKAEAAEVIRLVNGQNPLQGFLQVLNDGIWSYVCSSLWSDPKTNVTCRMLRNNSNRAQYSEPWAWKTCFYNISCSGNELSIDECMNGGIYKTCFIHETVAVRCGEGQMISKIQTPSGIVVRLVNGYNQNEGQVEIGVNGTWRFVANTNNSWGNKEASVICRMLGYSAKNAIGFNTPTLTNVQCNRSEDAIEFCSINTGNSCKSNRYLFLYCDCIYSDCNDNISRYCDVSLGVCKPDCGPGRYLSQPYCNPCSIGTYQPAFNQNRCYLCTYGTYQNLTGQMSCTSCPVGTYIDMIGGQTSCKVCPPGTYQDKTGQSSCKECNAGTYQNKAEQTVCLACNPGTYQNASGKTICFPCGGGKTTKESGSTSQSECYKGQRDELRQETEFNILIIGSALLAVMVIFDLIACAVIMRKMVWDSRTSKDTTVGINLPSLRRTEFGRERALTNDAYELSSRQDRQLQNKEETNTARDAGQDKDYEKLHSYANTMEMYDFTNMN